MIGALLCQAATLRGEVTLERKPSPPQLSTSIHGLALPVPDRLWIAGEGGLFLLSGELGQAWWGPKEPTDLRLLDVAFGDRDHGWAVGAAGTVLRTRDGGGTWIERRTGSAGNFHAAWASGPSELWIGGSDGVILHTADGGETWETQRLARDGVVRRFFFQAGTGWAVGDHGMVLRTADRGETWIRLGEESVQTRVNLHGIAFLSDRHGHAWGDDGTLLRTTDGGRRWHRLDLGTPQTIRDLLFPTAGRTPGRPLIALATGAILAVEGLTGFRTGAEIRVLETSTWNGAAIHRGVAVTDGSVAAVGSRGLVARVTWLAGKLRIEQIVGQAPEPGAENRAQGVVDAAAAFLGATYRLDPLGEGQEGEVDRDPRYSEDGFDCVTLIEQALALEVSGGGEALLPALDRIRYRAGRVGFDDRNHFFVVDWIPRNSWLVEDVTTSVGGAACRRIARRIDRRRVFRAHGIERQEPEEERSTWILPTPEVQAVADRLEDGDIAVMIGNRRWLFALHAGILLRRPDAGSRLFLRHASGAVGRVIDEDFFRYLERDSPRLVGVKILRLVE